MQPSDWCKFLCKRLGTCWIVFLLGLILLILLLIFRKWFLWVLLIYLLCLVLLGLLAASFVLAALVRRLCAKAQEPPKGQGSIGQQGPPGVQVPSHTYKRPDPLIYSQQYLMAQGFAVSWDNPDIHLELNGSTVSSHDLQPDTTYKIVAQVHNGSFEAPAVHLPVRFYYLSFGIGTTRNFIDETFVNLAVKGAPGEPTIAECLWTTPSDPGHYCIQVELVWPDDANPANNLGQENVDVKPLNSPTATFEFVVRNATREFRELRLEADSYAIPPQVSCEEVEAERRGAGEGGERASGIPLSPRTWLFARHRRAANPIPAGWTIEFAPDSTLAFRPGEQRTVTVTVVTDGALAVRQAINVHAFTGEELIGGVTLYVHD